MAVSSSASSRRQVGEDARDPLGQRRLARLPWARRASGGGRRPRRPRRRTDVVHAERGRPCRPPPSGPGRATRAAGCPTWARRAAPRAPRSPRSSAADLGQRAEAEHAHARHHGRLAGLWLGDEDPLDAARGRGHHHRQHPGHGPQPAGQRELADEDGAVERLPGGSGRRPPGPPPRSRGRSGCRSSAGRPATSRIVIRLVAGHSSLTVHDRHPAPVAGLVERHVGATDQGRARPGPGDTSAWTSIRWPRAPWREIVWAVAHGIRPRPRTWSTTDGPRRGRRRRRPGRSGARSACDARAHCCHEDAEARSAGRPSSEVDRLVRGAAGDAAAGLHLAHRRARAVAQHQVDLARRRTASCGRAATMPCSTRWRAARRLAVRPERAVVHRGRRWNQSSC